MTGYRKVALLLGLVLAAPAPARCDPQATMEPLAGQWERREGKTTITLTFSEEGRLHLVVTGGGEGFTLHADCQVTRDGIGYGIVTSADLATEEQEDEITDQVFRFRYRVDEGTLILRNFKASSKTLESEKIWEGRFRSVQPTPVRAAVPCSTSYPPTTVLKPGPTSSMKPLERLVPTPLPSPR